MIQDLKNDSARWEQERRSHSGGTISSRDSSVYPVRSRHSNSPPARYGDSSSRFGNGSAPAQYETSASPYPKASSRDSYEVVPRYPGNDAPGYSGAGSGGPPPNFQYDNRQAQYSNPGYSQPSSFAPPAQDNRYNQQPPPGNSFPQGSYGNPVYHPDGGGAPYMDVGAHRPARFQDTRMASNAYSAQPSGGQYYGQGQYTGGQPIDPMYGRGNNFSNTQPEYSSSQAQPGYEYPSTPAQFDGATAAPLPRGTTSSPTAAPAQTGTSGPSHSHSHRHRDRDTRDGSYSKSERSRRPPQ